jgi:hypothetical protein
VLADRVTMIEEGRRQRRPSAFSAQKRSLRSSTREADLLASVDTVEVADPRDRSVARWHIGCSWIRYPQPLAALCALKDCPMMQNTSFTTVDRRWLGSVVGGASRVTGRSGQATQDIMNSLTTVTNSIKDLSNQKPAMDPMMMMVMVMMMGNQGGAAAAAPVAAAPPPPPPPAAPIVRISNSIK